MKTPPPLFPVEIQKLKRGIYDKIKAQLPKSLKETGPDSMTIGQPPIKIVWRPNNYRREITIKKKANSTISKIRSTINSAKFSRISKLIDVPDFKGIILQYGKQKLTGIYKQNKILGKKEAYVLEGTPQEIEQLIMQRVAKIKNKIDIALYSFARKFNLLIPGNKPKWKRYEDEIKGESFIDSLPPDIIIHDTYFKKVYKKGLEFKGPAEKESPGVHAKNFIKNRALEDIAPDVARALLLQRPLLFLKDKIKSLREIGKYKDVITLLNDTEKAELEQYLFNTFGTGDF